MQASRVVAHSSGVMTRIGTTDVFVVDLTVVDVEVGSGSVMLVSGAVVMLVEPGVVEPGVVELLQAVASRAAPSSQERVRFVVVAMPDRVLLVLQYDQ
jgi:hypothetical protein